MNSDVPSAVVEGACASGGLAIRAGINAIESGRADVVLVNGVEKMTDVSSQRVTSGLVAAASAEFEQVHGSDMGITQVMRHEHEQMRSLMSSMQDALDAEDKDAFLGEAETLLVFMQQHNAKEEMMLYPMADQLLAGQGDQVVSKMQAVVEK